MPFERINFGTRGKLVGEVVRFSAGPPYTEETKGITQQRQWLQFVISPALAKKAGLLPDAVNSTDCTVDICMGTGADAGMIQIIKVKAGTDDSFVAKMKKDGSVTIRSTRIPTPSMAQVDSHATPFTIDDNDPKPALVVTLPDALTKKPVKPERPPRGTPKPKPGGRKRRIALESGAAT